MVQIIGMVLVGITNVSNGAVQLVVSITKREEISLKSVSYEVLLEVEAD